MLIVNDCTKMGGLDQRICQDCTVVELKIVLSSAPLLLYKSVINGLLNRVGSASAKVAWSRYIQRAKGLSFQVGTK